MSTRIFPRLKVKRSLPAGLTSGGEQQMTAIGRALMAKPRLVLLDEPSMGLAPMIVEDIFNVLSDLNRTQGLSLLIAEQNAAMSLRHAQRAYVLENGKAVLEGEAARAAAARRHQGILSRAGSRAGDPDRAGARQLIDDGRGRPARTRSGT